MRAFISLLSRYALLGLLSAGTIILTAMAGIVVSSGYLPWPETVFVGGYGGATLGLLLAAGFYLLGRADGSASGFFAGVEHRDRQAAYRAEAARAALAVARVCGPDSDQARTAVAEAGGSRMVDVAQLRGA